MFVQVAKIGGFLHLAKFFLIFLTFSSDTTIKITTNL